jgi:WD40 repeat protein/transcriptional regulator with XRE-family HTH domain
MDTSHAPESFRGLLLRHRGRTSLIQRDLAARARVSLRSLQDWEAGVSLPSAERLQGLIGALLGAGGLTPGRERSEARVLWAAVERETPRLHTPFDEAWFVGLLAARAGLTSAAASDVHTGPTTQSGTDTAERAQDWGEAPDTSGFIGRAEELAWLQGWLVDERCRLVAVLGMGGIGKTMLAASLAQQVAASFERVYWRSLRNAPPVGEWLAGAIGFLSDQHVVPPPSESEQIAALLQLLRSQRCLLVLDNSETLFEPGQREGRYRAGMDGYGRVVHAVGEASHQSCLILTSREAPPELAVLGAGAQSLELHGLGTAEAQELLADKHLTGDADTWVRLVERYGGNGLALKIVSETIRQVYDGAVGAFLEDAIATYGTVFGGIRRLLDAQAQRLSPIERDLLTRMAVEREPVNLAELSRAMPPSAGRNTLIEAVENLRRRSLVERGEGGATFTLQSMVLEYVTDRLVEAVADEIELGQPLVLVEQPLIQAQAKDYVRQTQERLIGGPILQRLKAQHSERGVERQLLALLGGWRGRPEAEQGYGPGNVVNLLRLLRSNLRGMDLSELVLRQVYLQETDAQDVSLAGSHLAEFALTDAFDFCVPLIFSPDGRYLAAGTHGGEVCVWQLADRTRTVSTQGHQGAVHGIDWAQDGRLLATGGLDGMVKLWDPLTGQLLATLKGHAGLARDVCFSGDGDLLASGSLDATVRVWETSTGRLLHTLQGHTGGVWGVSLSNDGAMVASASADGTVKLWETASGSLLSTLEAHKGIAYDVAFTPNGRLVASGGQDGVVRLWEVATGRLVATLQAHTQLIWNLDVSADGQLLVTGSQDGTVRLWDVTQTVPGGVCLTALEAHAGGVLDVAISGDARLIASAGQDGTLRLWEAPSGKPVTTLQGYARGAWGLAWDGSGRLLANGTQDGTINLWNVPTGALRARLRGHIGFVFGTALSPDGELLATGGFDYTIRLWRVADGLCLRTVQAHEGSVSGIALSPDGRLLISGGQDGWIKLWDCTQGVPGEEPLATIQAHAGPIWNVALSGDGHLLASASQDGTLKLWDIPSGQLLATMRDHDDLFWGAAVSRDGMLVASGGHSGRVTLWEAPSGRLLATLGAHAGQAWGIALSGDKRLLASGGVDGAVMLWDVAGGRLITQLTGHDGPVDDVAVSPDGSLIASSGQDGALMLWDRAAGTRRAILRPDRRYERMDISGLTGVNEVQKVVLRTLGAVERTR